MRLTNFFFPQITQIVMNFYVNNIGKLNMLFKKTSSKQEKAAPTRR